MRIRVVAVFVVVLVSTSMLSVGTTDAQTLPSVTVVGTIGVVFHP